MSTTRKKSKEKKQSTGKQRIRNLWFSFTNTSRNVCHLNQDVSIAGPSRPKSPRIENSFIESLRPSLKEEKTSEIKRLLVESQREMMKLLKPKTGENVREKIEEETENETRNFCTPTKSFRINSTQNDNPSTSRDPLILLDVPNVFFCC